MGYSSEREDSQNSGKPPQLTNHEINKDLDFDYCKTLCVYILSL